MTNAESIVAVSNESIDVKYDNVGENHFVYVGLNDQVRRVQFPTRSMALQFMDSMYGYAKLKVS